MNHVETVWARLQQAVDWSVGQSQLLEDENGRRAGKNVWRLRALADLIDGLITDEIIRGRHQGAEWGELGGSKQYTYGRYARSEEVKQTHGPIG